MRNRLLVLATTLVFGSAFAGITALEVRSLHDDRERDVQRSAGVLARTVEARIVAEVQSVDLLLGGVLAAFDREGRDGDREAFRRTAEALSARLPTVRRVSIFDAQGQGTVLVGIQSGRTVDIGDREYFRAHGRGIEGPTLTWLDASRTTGRPVLVISRRIEDADGRFEGIVAAAVDERELNDLLRSFDAAGVAALALFSRSGTAVARAPDENGTVGRSFAEDALFREWLPHAPVGFYLSGTPGLDADRYVSYRAIDANPFVVTVSVDRFAVDGAVERALFGSLPQLALLLLATAATMMLWSRENRVRRRLGLENAEHLTRAAASERREAQILDTLPAHVALLDGEGRIRAVNAGWRQFAAKSGFAGPDYGLAASYDDLVRGRRGADTAGHAERADAVRRVLQGNLPEYEVEFACGTRDLWFRLRATPANVDGEAGAVVCYLDVSERKRAEVALERAGETLRVLSDHVDGVLYLREIDASGESRYLFAGGGALGALGFTPEEVVASGQLIRQLLPAEEGERLLAAVNDAHATETPVTIEFHGRTRAGGERRFRATSQAVLRPDGSRLVAGLLLDVTERWQAERALAHAATHDPLTDLPNREAFHARLADALAASPAPRLAVHYVDFDDFHDANDTLGLERADALLRVAAERLREVLGEGFPLARLSGDDFAVLQENVGSPEEAMGLARTIVGAFEGRVLRLPGADFRLTASVGVAWAAAASTADAILVQADAALQDAKAAGKNTVRPYRPELGAAAQQRVTLRAALADAIERRQFHLHYQPKVDLRTGETTGCEALLRWNHPAFGAQSPATFVPVAEQSGLIVPIGEWALHEACRRAKAWQDEGLPPITVAVNVSAEQFRRSNLRAAVLGALENSGLPPSSLELELTERIIFNASDSIRHELEALHDAGVSLALDDFGTGYSSLAYLRTFPLDIIKVDQSFVRGMLQSRNARSIVATIVALGQGLDLKVVAEGVETEEELRLLQELGCDEVQGFLFSRPIPGDAIPRFVHEAADRRRALSADAAAMPPHRAG